MIISVINNNIYTQDMQGMSQGCREIVEHFSEEEIYGITGQPISHPTWSVSRIKWL